MFRISANWRIIAGANLVPTTIQRGEIIWPGGKVAPRGAEELRLAW
jgi:hypothetical protein